jgi:hypothetical protein
MFHGPFAFAVEPHASQTSAPQPHPAPGGRFNSIGFFQISKCTTLPLAAAVNFVVVGERPSRRVMLCLAWLTVGIAVTTATDVQITPMGCIAAALAVVSTVLNQVWAGQLMKNEGLTSVQYTHALSPYAGLLLMALCVPLDYLATGIRIDRWLMENVQVPLVVRLTPRHAPACCPQRR